MSKSNKKADKLRAQGNDFYQQREFCKALLAYNFSLCFAKTNTEAVGLAFGNRSAVYFSLEEYELCLENINLAKTHNYPLGKMEKLNQREVEAKRILEKEGPKPEDERAQFFKMSYPPHPKYPFLVDCLEVRQHKNAQIGKHLITTRDLKPGDVIAVTDPCFVSFDQRARLHHCSNCYDYSKNLSLIPCAGCSKAMYCSEECKTIHLERLHQFECAETFKSSLTKEEIVAEKTKRALCELLYRFEWDVDAVKTFFYSHRNQHSVFDFDMSDPKEYYKNLLFVSTNPEFFSACGYYHPSTIDQVVEAVNLFVQKNEKLRNLFASPRAKEILKFLARTLPNITCERTDMVFFTSNIDMTVKDFTKEGEIPVEKPLNTYYCNSTGDCSDPGLPVVISCDYSVSTKQFKGKRVWIINRPVKAGEKLSRSNLPTHLREASKKDRQQYLSSVGFTCTCKACKLDWKFSKEPRSVENQLFCLLPLGNIDWNAYVDPSHKNHFTAVAKVSMDLIPKLYNLMPNKEYWMYRLSLVNAHGFLAYPRLFNQI